MPMHELTLRLGSRLEAFKQPVKLATDSIAWDWPWIHEIFGVAGTWPANLDGKPEILKQGSDFNLAIEQAYAGGLRRHHALDDARANRIAQMLYRVV